MPGLIHECNECHLDVFTSAIIKKGAPNEYVTVVATGGHLDSKQIQFCHTPRTHYR
jgi:hypothetical protein